MAMNGYGATQPTVTISGGPVVARAVPTEGVNRLGEQLDLLEKAVFAHAERLDPVLRPSPPCNVACDQASPIMGSRLALMVERVGDIRRRLDALTDRLEA